MWQKGQSGNLNGRPVRNEKEKANIAYFKKKLAQYSVEALEELYRLMNHSLNHEIVYKCCTYILDRYIGKEPLFDLEQEKNNVFKLEIVSVPGKEGMSEQDRKDIWEAENSILDDEQSGQEWDTGDILDEEWGNDVYHG